MQILHKENAPFNSKAIYFPRNCLFVFYHMILYLLELTERSYKDTT